MPSNENRPKTCEPQIAAIILTCNEEINLPLCLASLKGLDAEIFVVDSGSTDRTREIAVAAGAKVLEHPFENYAAQRNWAQNNLPIRSEWILHLDADERLTPDLVEEIRDVLRARPETLGVASDADRIEGFLLRKRTFFMGRWIRHGGHYPSYHLRLFRKGKGFCEERLYDQHFVVNGKIATLKHDYLDVLCSDINTWIERHTRWAELEAKQLLMGSNGKAQVRPALFGSPIERRRWMRNGLYGRSPLYLRAFLYWVYRYFFRLGFLDGKEGFVFHFMQGFWFRLLVDIKLDKIRKQETSEGSDQKSEVRRQA
ncbi:MAG: hypothetical protein A3F90_01125 [Deltaproteobacteria bacterium RIFCSPLOWO2_12_FULL_60_19]|nr:MAG: hypothetical protein A3F90_01125 [Deltaproteobacteria bacterium RIFCSPLOWO2_12_FULL_60_19]